MSVCLKALQKTGNYNKLEELLFENEVVQKRYPKGEVMTAKGEVATSVYYLVSGAVVQRIKSNEGWQNIIDLHTENEWLVNHLSFVSQSPSNSEMVAYTDVVVLELSIHAIHLLVSKSLAFLQLNRVLDQATARLHFFDFSLTPIQKYRYMFEQKPVLLQHFPLKMIASYLKISPETLSRVREQFGRSKAFLDLNQVL
jgi:CRP-like cAMP-binding protein